jgi:hypothetical protein
VTSGNSKAEYASTTEQHPGSSALKNGAMKRNDVAVNGKAAGKSAAASTAASSISVKQAPVGSLPAKTPRQGGVATAEKDLSVGQVNGDMDRGSMLQQVLQPLTPIAELSAEFDQTHSSGGAAQVAAATDKGSRAVPVVDKPIPGVVGAPVGPPAPLQVGQSQQAQSLESTAPALAGQERVAGGNIVDVVPVAATPAAAAAGTASAPQDAQELDPRLFQLGRRLGELLCQC